MKLSLHRTGGFVGIALHASVETTSLASEIAKQVEDLVSRLPQVPPPPAVNPNARDAFTYEIVIDGRTYRVDDSIMPDAWRPLVDWLVEHGG